MDLYKRLEEATEAANRLRMITPTEDEVKYFTKDLATVIVFLDTTLPLFLNKVIQLAKEADK